MAEITRYQRSEAAQAVPTSKAEANNLNSLADRLRQFSNKQFEREAQQAGIEGKQAGQLAASGKIGGLDLSDNSTIRSRAFNSGAQLAHASQIKIDINENISRIKMENPYDVAAFQELSAGYKKGLLAEVDPSMRALAEADLNTAISNGTIRIGEDFMKKEQKAQVATITQGVELAKELTLQLFAKGDIEGGEDQMMQIKAALEEGVTLNLLDQAEVNTTLNNLSELADYELILGTFKRELEENGVEAAETAIDAFEAYEEELIDDEGNERSIEPKTKRTIISKMNTMINRVKADENSDAAAAKALKNAEKAILKDAVTDHIKALDLNQFPETLEDLKVKLAGFPDLQSDLAKAESEAAAAAVFMTVSPTIMEFQIQKMSGSKTLSPAKAQLLERYKKIYADTKARMNTDILNLGIDHGLIEGVDTLDFSNGEQIKKRVLQYRQLQDHYGVSGGSPLTQSERDNLITRLEDTETGTKNKLVILSSLVDGFGNASVDLFESMFEDTSPEYIMVGELISESRSTGNFGLIKVGENILLGLEAIDKGLVEVDPDLKNIILMSLGDAAGKNPDYQQMVIQSATALFVNKHRGNTDDVPDMQKEVDKFITQITGGVLEINGSNIIAPNRNINTDMFEEKLDTLDRNDLNAMGGVDLNRYTATEALEMVKDGRFESVGQGQYVVIISEKGDVKEELRNKFGETFIFNYDTKWGDKKSWTEDGFAVDYIKFDKEAAANAKANEYAAETQEAAEDAAELDEAAALVMSESYDSENPPEYKYEDGRFYTGAVQMINDEPHDAAGKKLILTQTTN